MDKPAKCSGKTNDENWRGAHRTPRSVTLLAFTRGGLAGLLVLMLAACTGTPTLLAATAGPPGTSVIGVVPPGLEPVAPTAAAHLPLTGGQPEMGQPDAQWAQVATAVSTVASPPEQMNTGPLNTGQVNTVQVTLQAGGIQLPGAVPAGQTQFKVTNADMVTRGLGLVGMGFYAGLEVPLAPGTSGTFEVPLPPGEYTLTSVAQPDSSEPLTRTLVVFALPALQATVAPDLTQAPPIQAISATQAITATAAPTATASQATLPPAVTVIIVTATPDIPTPSPTTTEPPAVTVIVVTATPDGSTPSAPITPTTPLTTSVPLTATLPVTPLATLQPFPTPAAGGAAVVGTSSLYLPLTGVRFVPRPLDTQTAGSGPVVYIPVTAREAQAPGEAQDTQAQQVQTGEQTFLPLTGAQISMTVDIQTPVVPLPAEMVTLTLTAREMRFGLGELEVPAGAQVRLLFTNHDTTSHNFSLYSEGQVLETLFEGLPVTADQGAAVTTVYIFTAPVEPGVYYFRCDSHPFQMSGRFIVR